MVTNNTLKHRYGTAYSSIGGRECVCESQIQTGSGVWQQNHQTTKPDSNNNNNKMVSFH